MKDVFISYKAEEFDEANWVKTILETNGISCWMAPMCIPGGSSYAVEIPQAIRECKVFVLILSEKSQLSKWVPRELDQAINAGKIVLPFMLENCPLKDDFNFYLTNVQRYAAYENKARAIEKMLTEIKAIIGAKDTAETESGVKSDDNSKSVPLKTEATETFSDSSEKAFENKENAEEEEEESFGILDKLLEHREKLQKQEAERKVVEKRTKEQKRKTVKTEKTRPSKKKDSLAGYICFILVGVIVIVILSIILSSFSKIEIAGKKFSKNSYSLSLENVTVTEKDINKLPEFKELSSIDLRNCNITPYVLGELSKYANYSLTVKNCGLTDDHLKSIGEADPNLRYFYFNDNEEVKDISDLSPLADTLEEIYFSNCGVKDLSALSQFTHLETIKASNNEITDVSSLGMLSDLVMLEIADNSINDISMLKLNKKLEFININGNCVESLEGLESAISLCVLKAADNKLTDLSGIENTTVLQDVDLKGNGISDFSVLTKSAETLKYLELDGNPVSDISFVGNFVKLLSLSVDNTGIDSLAGVEKCVSLYKLSAQNNSITTADKVFTGGKITYLDLSDNQITSFEGLTVDIEDFGIILDLSNNALEGEVTIPQGKYKLLDLGGNAITGITGLTESRVNTAVIQYAEEMDFTALKEFEVYDYYILDCPLDKELSVSEILGKYDTYFTDREGFVSEYYVETQE